MKVYMKKWLFGIAIAIVLSMTTGAMALADNVKLFEYDFNTWGDAWYSVSNSPDSSAWYTLKGENYKMEFNDGTGVIINENTRFEDALKNQMKYRLYLKDVYLSGSRAAAIGYNSLYDTGSSLSNNGTPYIKYRPYTGDTNIRNAKAEGYDKLVVGGTVRCDNPGGARFAISFNQSDGTTKFNRCVYLKAGGTIETGGVAGVSHGTWENGKVYKITVVPDIGTNKGDIFINGKMIAKDVVMGEAGKEIIGINFVYFYADFTTKTTDPKKLAYYDDLKVYSGDIPRAASADELITVDEGENKITVPTNTTVADLKEKVSCRYADVSFLSSDSVEKNDTDVALDDDIIKVSDGIFNRYYTMAVAKEGLNIASVVCKNNDVVTDNTFTDGNVDVTFNVVNYDDSFNTGVFLAQYNEDGKIIGINYAMKNLTRGEDSLSCSLNTNGTEGTTFKAMLLNMATMRPCCKAIPITYKKPTKAVGATDSALKYVGRWTTDTDYQRANWGGAYFETSFTGTQFKIQIRPLDANLPDVYVTLDGQSTRLLAADYKTNSKIYDATTGILNIAPKNLADENHKIRVSSAHMQREQIYLKNVIVDETAALSAPTQGKKLIEFIGDSITSGAKTDEGYWSAQDTFAWRTGESLGCDHTQISVAGIAMMMPRNTFLKGMNEHYFETYTWNYTDTSPKWNFSKYTPDVIVINLGQNDYYPDSTHEQPTDEEFRDAYVEFVKNIRAKFSDAPIFIMKTFSGLYGDATAQAVTKLNTNGDTNVYFVDTTDWVSMSDCPDSVHPNVSAHTRAAQLLSDIIAQHINK